MPVRFIISKFIVPNVFQGIRQVLLFCPMVGAILSINIKLTFYFLIFSVKVFILQMPWNTAYISFSTSAIARLMAIYAVLDFGALHTIITASANGILASGSPYL